MRPEHYPNGWFARLEDPEGSPIQPSIYGAVIGALLLTLLPQMLTVLENYELADDPRWTRPTIQPHLRSAGMQDGMDILAPDAEWELQRMKRSLGRRRKHLPAALVSPT